MMKYNKKSIQVSCLVAFLLFLLLVSFKEQLLVTEDFLGVAFYNYQANLLFQYVIFSFGIVFLVFWRGKISNPLLSKMAAVLTLVVMPLISFWMFESIVGNFETILAGNFEIIKMNCYIWYLLYGGVFALTNSFSVTIIFMNVFTYILAVANAFVVQFRLQPILPMDVSSFFTAASVAGDFEYDFSPVMIIMGVLCCMMLLWTTKVDFKLSTLKSRLLYTGITVGCTWYVLSGMLVGDWFEKAGAPNLDFFRFNITYANEGYMSSTMKCLRFLKIEKPKNYSDEKVQEILEHVEAKHEKEELPENVIVIMNEAFSDLSVLGEFRTSEPILSFFNGLEGDAVRKGNLYVSSYGGNTANTEFEFLTGNSMAYMPYGSVPYQVYVEKGDTSIVSCFKDNGYRTIAFHPFRRENYNRHKVYEIYGFDEYYAIEDVKVKNIRRFASDKSDYKALIKMHKNKKDGEKLFIFNVTMQNHAGYDYYPFDNDVRLVDYPEQYFASEQYLGLIKKSDEALKYLLDYFSKVDEKTVVLLFGDHQPRLEDGFTDLLLGTEADTFDGTQKKYITRYLLWANYPLSVEEKENISANYLGSYLLDAVGMELPVYNQYLLDLQGKIPAINTNGYLDNSGEMHMLKEENTKLLEEYQILQYNNLFSDKAAYARKIRKE